VTVGGTLKNARGEKKVDNASRGKAAKVEIRRNVMAALGEPARVFDGFAGAGHLYRAVWREAASYTGCDQRYFADGRRMFVADNRRVLRSLDLAAFNLFDLDAYGSPWEQALIVAARRRVAPGERIGMVFTEGNGLNYKGNVVPAAVTQLIGLQHAKVVGLFTGRDQVQGWIIQALADRFRADVVRRWQAGSTAGQMVAYLGVVFQGREVSAEKS